MEWWGAERGAAAPGGMASLPNVDSALIYAPWGLALFVCSGPDPSSMRLLPPSGVCVVILPLEPCLSKLNRLNLLNPSVTFQCLSHGFLWIL